MIEGCAIAAYAISAETCYIYIRGEYTEPLKIVSDAVDEAYANGVLGANVLGSGKRIEVVLHRGAGAYICGEETAMLNSIEGKRGNPRIKPPYPAQAGVFGLPTTINNVETLACVPHIVTRGAAWHKSLSLSSPRSTGTKLISVCGHVQRPGNYEITMGFPMQELIFDLAGGMRPGRTLKAVIPGGSSVPIMNAAEVAECATDYEGVVAQGSMLGSGGMIVMHDSTDMVQVIWRLAKFYAHESCAQCTQCREGTAWSTKVLERILAGKGKEEDLQLLLELSENMTGKTICVLSDSCAAPIVSGIQKFRGEFEAYISRAKRPAMAAV
jgi:NADH-quinone oxidoreductase subunit F